MTNTADDPFAPYTDPDFVAERQDSWAKNLPSGFRQAPTDAEARQWLLRSSQTQRVERKGLQVTKFTGCQFVGHIIRGMRTEPNGDFRVEITIPYEFKNLAMPLTDAVGLPLSIDVELWKPFVEDRGGDDG